jgi:hypothetical protein
MTVDSRLRPALVLTMIEVTTIPMERFSLRWRLTDPKYRVLPPLHLEQIQPLDAESARRLVDLTRPWYQGQPFARECFADVVSTSIDVLGDEEVRRIRKWLYQRGVPFGRRVFLSWGDRDAAVTTWKMVVKYWNALWYPSSDDLAVFDESLSWALFLWHEEEAFFASRPVSAPPRAR